MATAILVRGDKLSLSQRHDVLGAFVHRWTVENQHRATIYGQCPVCGVVGGRPDDPATGYVAPVECRQHHPTVPLETDAQWLLGHAFYIRKDGRLAARPNHCEPAWMTE